MTVVVPGGYILFEKALESLDEDGRLRLRQILDANDGEPPEFATSKLSLIMDPKLGKRSLPGRWWVIEDNWIAAVETGKASHAEAGYFDTTVYEGPIAVRADLVARVLSPPTDEAAYCSAPADPDEGEQKEPIQVRNERWYTRFKELKNMKPEPTNQSIFKKISVEEYGHDGKLDTVKAAVNRIRSNKAETNRHGR